MKKENMKEYAVRLEDFSIEAIAESGQCFRITACSYGSYTVNALGRVLNVREEGDGKYIFSCDKEEFDLVWRKYFDLDSDYSVYKGIALSEDEYLNKAISFGDGIRILNQDKWEMLISFIISQRKSVPAIRTSIERLSALFGEKIDDDGHYSFPSPKALTEAKTVDLCSCGLGYRVDYVREAARAVYFKEADLEGYAALETPVLIDELMRLKGVGIKVASCIALFGYHRLDTVPVDVWMKRVIDIKYGGSLPKEYAPYAGVLQQYMFNYARLNNGVL